MSEKLCVHGRGLERERQRGREGEREANSRVTNVVYPSSRPATKKLECLTEKVVETRGYSNSIIAVDLDSLVGVNASVSESNMGPSHSYSVHDQVAWSFVLDVVNHANVDERGERSAAIAYSLKLAYHEGISHSFL